MNKILCILQARMSSTRLPWKVLKEINSKPLLEYEIERIKKSKLIDKLVIATSSDFSDNEIELFCKNNLLECFRWDLNDVLKRYHDCSIKYSGYNIIVRITWDCPLIDENIIDQTIELFLKSNVSYCSNIEPETFPDGMDVEVFSKKALDEAYNNSILPSEREHVTPYIRKHLKKINYALKDKDLSSYRLTVDEQKDFDLTKLLIENVWPNKSYTKYIDYINKNNININSDIKRNEWIIKSISQDYLQSNKQKNEK